MLVVLVVFLLAVKLDQEPMVVILFFLQSLRLVVVELLVMEHLMVKVIPVEVEVGRRVDFQMLVKLVVLVQQTKVCWR